MTFHRLPPEVITEILCRLPVPTLLLCRSVSKQWRAVIDTHHFIKLHLNHSLATNTNNTLFLQTDSGHLFAVNFDTFSPGKPINLLHESNIPLHNQGDVRLIGSYDGLLCISQENDDILIFNTSTRKCYHIPIAFAFHTGVPVAPDRTFIYGTGYGFGYDRVANDYKVVRIAQFVGLNCKFQESEMMIYCVKTNMYRVVKMPYVLRNSRRMGLFVGGGLHWIVGRFDDLSKPHILVAYDLEADEFRELPQPEYVGNRFSINIGVLGSCLCVFVDYRNVGVDVWVMKEYGVKESWTKLFSVPHFELCYNDSVRPVGYSKKGGEVLLELDQKRFVWYDLEKRRAKDVVIQGLQTEFFEAIICLRSLVRPDVNGELEKEQQHSKKKTMTMKERDDFLLIGCKLKL